MCIARLRDAMLRLVRTSVAAVDDRSPRSAPFPARAAALTCAVLVASIRPSHDGILGVEESGGRTRSVFQSVIAIELAVAGALLWQIRYFESGDRTRRETENLPDSRLRLGLALVLGATLFASLWAIADEGPKWAALAVTVGLAISLIPIVLRVLPPLAKDASTDKRDPEYVVTVLGLILYVAVVAAVLVLLDIE